MALSETDRRDLLHSYITTEPTITVNCETFLVSVGYQDPDHVIFYAVTPQGAIGAITKVVRKTWNEITKGMSMAYMYNTVLETLERGLKQTGGRLQVA